MIPEQSLKKLLLSDSEEDNKLGIAYILEGEKNYLNYKNRIHNLLGRNHPKYFIQHNDNVPFSKWIDAWGSSFTNKP